MLISGIIDIAFLDKRENPDLDLLDVYYAKIVDGRVSKNIRVNPSHLPNRLGGRFPGDYLDMVVAYPEKTYIGYPCEWDEVITLVDACMTAIDPNLVPLRFIRGDINQDNTLDVSDAITILLHLFKGQEIGCLDAADVDDDGRILITDAISVLDYLFKGEGAPKAPFPEPGIDPTEDNLNC